MAALIYKPEYQAQWDEFVRESHNATFLLERHFMDYHKDRFEDGSVVFTNEKGQYIGLLPASLNPSLFRVDSHGGLTYGGLLLKKGVSLTSVNDMLREAAHLYMRMGMKTLRYKPIPYIYHQYPAQEDLYCLFRANAQLVARTVSSTIDLNRALPFSTLRKRKVKKAVKEQLQVREAIPDDWETYWKILTDVLEQQHHTHPVHSLQEICYLKDLFPKQIQLYVVVKEQQCLAGCVIFKTKEVAHVQYIASNPEGKEVGALDYLFSHLIARYQLEKVHYFDFGISTEDGGKYLNEGLLFQKEGLGGRAICYDTYDVNLENLIEP